MTSETLVAAGLMSGTSADGIDAALVAVTRSPRRITLRHYREIAHPESRRQRILDACDNRLGTGQLALLHGELGQAFGDAVLALCAEAGVDVGRLDVIGSHGQTVWHAPRAQPPVSLQVGDPARIAQLTGCAVVADFRSADLAVGGQGAPLTPMLHRVLFGHGDRNRAVVNIGGIANVTWLPAGADGVTDGGVMAVDSGPGNMVIDALSGHFSEGRRAMDVGGAWAAHGVVDQDWLNGLLADPYFALAGPKSTGRERFGGDYAARLAAEGAGRGLAAESVLATATALTAHSIVDAIRRMGPVDEVLLCGGGALNDTLVAMLSEALGGEISVSPTDRHGMSGAALEAVAFAELACRHLWGETGNLPRVTGAKCPVVLGARTPGHGRQNIN